MQQEANIYEIAKEAGVSIATVSRVINNSNAVSEKSRKKVLDAIEKLNYVPNSNARSLSTATSSAIGVVIPDLNNHFFSQLLQGITRAADERGLQIILCHSNEDRAREHQMLLSLRQQRLRGLIVTPVSEKDDTSVARLREYEKLGIPVVLLDREFDNDLFDRVVAEDNEGVFKAVSELIRIGHRKIAIVTGPQVSRSGHERLNGYRRALKTHGIPVNQDYIREGDFKVQKAFEQTMALMQLPDPPTAIISSNNLTTFGCIWAFGELGLKVGEDVALIGVDDIDALGWMNYHISVVNRDVRGMGEQAMRMLYDRFDNEKITGGRRHCLPTELILRGSEHITGL